MSRGGQTFGKHQLRVLSASQVERYECPRKWAFANIDGLREPTTAAQTRGVDVHYQMEVYGQQGTMPTHPLALEFVRHAPTPGTAAIEVPVSLSTPSSPWVGFIDAAADLELESEPVWCTTGRERIPRLRVQAKWAELGTTGVTCLVDYKTVGNIRNAKRAEDLLENTAANLYAWAAFEGGAKRVFGLWLYGDETLAVKPVWFEFKLGDVVENIIALDSTAAIIQSHWAAKTPAAEMDTNTSVCHRYRRRDPKPGEPTGSCWYLEAGHCRPISTFHMPTSGEQDV